MKLNKFILPIFLLGLVACSEDEIGNSEKWKVEGVVPANFVGCINKAVSSRSTIEGIWEPGNAIGISGGDKYINCKYVAETEGTDRHFTPATKEDSIYFDTSDPISFTAYYPYTGATGAAAGVINKTITAEDQSEQNQTNIDYLFGTGQGSKASPLVALELEHKMALISFKFNNGYGVDLDQMENFTISGLKLSGEFNPLNGNAVATSEITEDITIPADQYTGSSYTKSLIFFPQTNLDLNISASFGTYNVSGKLPITSLASGYKYTCVVTVNKGGLNVIVEDGVEWDDDLQTSNPQEMTSMVKIPALPSGDGVSEVKLSIGGTEISDFNPSTEYPVASGQEVVLSFKLADGKRVTAFDGSPKSGSCKMHFSYQDGVSKCTYSDLGSIVELNEFGLAVGDDSNTSISAPQVGDYYYSDGTWGKETGSNNIIGIVFNVGVGAGPGNFWGMNKYSGYVVALTNTDKRTVETDYNNQEDQSGRDVWGEGYDMTFISSDDTECLGYVTYNKVKDVSDFATHYKAIYTASTFDVKTPLGTSGWYLPSVGEFRLLSQNYKTVIFDKIKAIDDQACDLGHWWRTFWTSSKSSDNKPIYLDWNDNNNFEEFIKTDFNEKNPLVRPILTF